MGDLLPGGPTLRGQDWRAGKFISPPVIIRYDWSTLQSCLMIMLVGNNFKKNQFVTRCLLIHYFINVVFIRLNTVVVGRILPAKL